MKINDSLESFVLDILSREFWSEVFKDDKPNIRTRVFPWSLVIWLMLWQRLNKGRSLGSTMDGMLVGSFKEAIFRTGAGKTTSNNTGGYSQARNRLPPNVVEVAADKINYKIEELHSDRTWEGRKVYLADGSTLTLPHTKELLEKYPSCQNQHGKSPWPKMSICCMHDLITGVALRPDYAAMYGDNAINEVELLRRSLHSVPDNSIIVADRAYGIFRVVDALVKNGHDAVVRLTDDRAKRFLGLLKFPGETSLEWNPSAQELKKYSDLSKETSVRGRFIWHRLRRKGYKPLDLYIFTTLTMKVDRIIELYAMRWNIENDIRDLKHCLDLEQINAKTPQMIEKEVILGYTAYNLLRHIIAISAGVHKIEPRRVSFKRVLNLVTFAGPNMLSASSKEQAEFIKRFLEIIPKIINKPRKRPLQVRKKLYRREKFPPLKYDRKTERKMLKSLKKVAN